MDFCGLFKCNLLDTASAGILLFKAWFRRLDWMFLYGLTLVRELSSNTYLQSMECYVQAGCFVLTWQFFTYFFSVLRCLLENANLFKICRCLWIDLGHKAHSHLFYKPFPVSNNIQLQADTKICVRHWTCRVQFVLQLRDQSYQGSAPIRPGCRWVLLEAGFKRA